MITTAQATIGATVEWRSLDPTILATRGKIIEVNGNEFTVEWNEPDEYGEKIIIYASNNNASCVRLVKS